MKTNTVFIIGGLALLGFVFLRKKVQTTGGNIAPGTPEQIAPPTPPPTPPGSDNTVNPYGLTQEQADAIAKLEAFEALQGATMVPWLPGTITPWQVTGGQPGGGFLLPF
jgi:hypothetical protein